MVAPHRPLGPLAWSLLAAVWFGIVGVAFGALYLGRVPGQISSILIVLGGLGAFVAGGVTWGLLVEWPRKPTLVRGTIVGTLTGVIAHFVMGLIFMVVLGGFALFWNPSVDVVLRFLGAVAGFGLLGLLVTLFLTVPVGAVGGAVFACVRSRVTSGG